MQRLQHPKKPIRIVIDTDTKNEIDDQFAITYALLSQSEIVVEAIHAAPFMKPEYPEPELGMEASYQEILTVIDKMGLRGSIPVFKGSRKILGYDKVPVRSEAAENLIRLAMQQREDPLYVVGIAAITNIASAILLKPEIMERIVVVWLGGHPTYWETPREFNLQNDPIGAMVLFDSGIPLVHIPCKNVAEHLRTVPSEVEEYVRGRGVIGNYLADIFRNWVHHKAQSKPLWDITTIAYLINPEWVQTKLAPTPRINPDCTWGITEANRHLCRVAVDAKRDPIFYDLFEKLEGITSHNLEK